MDAETETRFAAIEQRLLGVESSHSTLNRIALQQMADNRESFENLTMLLGIAKGQEHDIRVMQTDITTIKADISSIKEQLTSVQVELHTGFAAMNERFEAILALLRGNEPKPPEQ